MRLAPLALTTFLLAGPAAADTTFLLVRHAEKVDASANPSLSAAGLRRAEALAVIAEEWGINAVFTTDFCRTAQTGLAAATARHMPLVVQPVSRGRGGIEDCEPPVAVPVVYLDEEIVTTEAFADYVFEDQAGRVLLVVGHSNTVPEMIRVLGGAAVPEVTMTDDEYDRLFVLTVPEDGSAPQLLEQRYGD